MNSRRTFLHSAFGSIASSQSGWRSRAADFQLACASTPQGTFEKTFQVSGPVDLEVQTQSGDITVRSGPAGSVSIHGKIFVGDHWLFGKPARGCQRN